MIVTVLALALQTAGSSPAPALGPDAALARMVALYDEVCLQAFPIDGAVDQLMAAKGATALTPDQVKVTLNDDPGRAWTIDDGGRTIQITLELPPYHACSVRRFLSAMPESMSSYRALADRFEAAHPGFVPVTPYDRDMGDIHVHAVGERRPLPSGGAETLYVYDQHVTDPAKRAQGQTAVNVRFVHQIVSPDAK